MYKLIEKFSKRALLVFVSFSLIHAIDAQPLTTQQIKQLCSLAESYFLIQNAPTQVRQQVIHFYKPYFSKALYSKLLLEKQDQSASLIRIGSHACSTIELAPNVFLVRMKTSLLAKQTTQQTSSYYFLIKKYVRHADFPSDHPFKLLGAAKTKLTFMTLKGALSEKGKTLVGECHRK